MTVTAPPLPGLLYAQAAEFQDRLVALEDQAAEVMGREWARTQAAVDTELDRFLERVAARRAAGTRVSPAWAFQEARWRQLQATAAEEYARHAAVAVQATTAVQAEAVRMGALSAASLGSAATMAVDATFQAVNPNNLRHLVGFLQDNTPLAAIFQSLGPEGLDHAKAVLTRGIILGRGVDPMRRDLRQAFDMPRWRAETIARTEAHRVFREASRETYAQNADVLQGWTWTAKLDSRTCPACVAMHGTVHAVGDTLDGHPRCRCAMVPLVRPLDGIVPPVIPTGDEWLRGQSAATQRAVLGPGKFAAYRAGDVDLGDLVHRAESPRFGTMRREATLAEAKASGRARVRRDQRAVRNTRRRRV